MGFVIQTSPVRTRGWLPGKPSTLIVTSPEKRQIPCWPMLWSGRSSGTVSGTLNMVGTQGLWSDAMVWKKFAVTSGDAVVAYVHGRDIGPAAPQPLPSGSDESVPHVAIGRV